MVNMVIRDDEKYWYAAYTRVNQEMSIKKKLDALNVENYLPLQEVVRQEPEGRKKVRELLVRGLIFLRTDRRTSFVLLNDYSLNIVYIRDRETRRSLIIPDKQMKDFMFVMNLDPAAVILNDDCFAVGTKVQVIKGDFCGVEGELASLSNRTYVTIRIRGVLSASVKVPKSYLRILAP